MDQSINYLAETIIVNGLLPYESIHAHIYIALLYTNGTFYRHTLTG